jgi:hypothetical protein
MIEKLGGRKFIFAIIAIILGFALVQTNHIEAQQFITFVEYIGTVYVAGNVIARATDSLTGENKE